VDRISAHWLLPLALASVLLCGCATTAPTSAQASPAMDVQPVEVTTTYIAARAPRFRRGEYAIVEICITPEGAIDTTRVTQTSADKGFDAAAMLWARQARYRPRLEDGRPVYGCEEVRVEINRNPGSHLATEADSALG